MTRQWQIFDPYFLVASGYHSGRCSADSQSTVGKPAIDKRSAAMCSSVHQARTEITSRTTCRTSILMSAVHWPSHGIKLCGARGHYRAKRFPA